MVAPLHGTAVAIAGRGVLLLGPSGSGKSDLAMRLIDRGARLVADDYVLALPRGGRLYLSAPPAIAGRIEVRGLGLLSLPALGDVPAALAVDLEHPPERLPDAAAMAISGVELPLVRLRPFEASAPVKLEWALARTGFPA